MRNGIEAYRVQDAQLYLAHGKRVSGDPRVEEEVLAARRELSHEPVGKGRLVAIGGAAIPENYDHVSKGVQSETGVVVVTFPTRFPEVAYADNKALFQHYTGEEPFHLGAHTIPEEGDAMLRLSSVAFIVGGDQLRARVAMENEGWDKKLHAFHEDGKTVAGTSAGAHVQGEVTSYGNTITRGIGLVREVSFDSHNVREREARQRDVAGITDVFSVGLPEGGGVIYEPNGRLEAFGKGRVNVLWQANGHQATKLLRDGGSLNVWSLPKNHPPQVRLPV
jgi:hypothetical protein